MSEIRETLLHDKIRSVSGSMSKVAIDSLLEAANYRKVAKGRHVLEEGMRCRNIFFVARGYLRMFKMHDGVEINTDFVFENNFGTSLKSLRMDVPSEIYITAGEATELYEFDKEKLWELYKTFPEIESFGRQLLEQLLVEQEEYLQMIRILSATERYKYLERCRPEIIRRISLSQISSYLGLARETLSRIRKVK